MREETEIQPNAGVSEDDEVVDAFLRRAPATLVSLIVHLVVLICLALLSYRIEVNEPFVMKDSAQLMEYLLVMAFGPEHREQVLKFFRIRSTDRRHRPGDHRPRRRDRI